MEDAVRTEAGTAAVCSIYLTARCRPRWRTASSLVATKPADFLALGLDFADKNLNGQMYTGPWDTTDQEVLFEWVQGVE